MIVVCKIDDNQNDIIQILLLGDNLNEIFVQTCGQSHFCEKLPEMIQNILCILHTKYNQQNIKNIEYETDFNLNKHITTYRIFKSFVCGLLLGAERAGVVGD